MHINKYRWLTILWLGLYGCSKDHAPYEELTDSKEGAMIFVAKANNGVQNLTIFPYEDRSLKFNVGFGALGLPANDIQVTLAEDTHAFDSLNVIRELNGLEPYERFPSAAYAIDQLDLTIPKGGIASNYAVLNYQPEAFDATKDHLLALSITDASGYAISHQWRKHCYWWPQNWKKGPRIQLGGSLRLRPNSFREKIQDWRLRCWMAT